MKRDANICVKGGQLKMTLRYLDVVGLGPHKTLCASLDFKRFILNANLPQSLFCGLGPRRTPSEMGCLVTRERETQSTCPSRVHTQRTSVRG